MPRGEPGNIYELSPSHVHPRNGRCYNEFLLSDVIGKKGFSDGPPAHRLHGVSPGAADGQLQTGQCVCVRVSE